MFYITNMPHPSFSLYSILFVACMTFQFYLAVSQQHKLVVCAWTSGGPVQFSFPFSHLREGGPVPHHVRGERLPMWHGTYQWLSCPPHVTSRQDRPLAVVSSSSSWDNWSLPLGLQRWFRCPADGHLSLDNPSSLPVSPQKNPPIWRLAFSHQERCSPWALARSVTC